MTRTGRPEGSRPVLHDEPQATGPLKNPAGDDDATQSPARDVRDAPRREPVPNTVRGGDTGPLPPILPPMEGDPDDNEGHRPDPGPPPSQPTFGGDIATAAVDQLLFAMEAQDRDAAMAVRTIGETPAVVQFKANVIEWLDRMDTYRNTKNMPQGQPVQEDDNTMPPANPGE